MNNGLFGLDSPQTYSNSITDIDGLLGRPSIIPSIYGDNLNKKPQINYDNLVFVIDTSKESNNIFNLPLAGTVNCTVDWGDGVIERFTTASNKSHTYPSRGEYTIQIYGILTSFTFSSATLYQPKLIRCLSFGTLALTSFNFQSCTNLIQVPSNLPTGVTSLANCFNGCSNFNWPIDTWDVSRVTSLASTFANSSFNRSLNSWNTSRVTNLAATFLNNSSFNEAIGSWNTSGVTSLSQTFEGTRFNQSISSWDTSRLTDMYRTFFGSVFNQPIGDWNTSSLTTLQQTFYNCQFNQLISGWNTSNVTNMIQTFALNGVFNQPIGSWNVGKVTSFAETFRDCAYNQPLSGWDTSSATTFSSMFYGNSRFNQPIPNWNVGKVTDFGLMFGGITSNPNTAFNSSISGWNIGANLASGVTASFGSMFSYNRVFNQPIENLNVGRVSDFSSMFLTNSSNPSVFNQSLSGWSTTLGTGVTTINMSNMFNSATLFNQPLSSWNVTKVTNFASMFVSTPINQDFSTWDIKGINAAGGLTNFMQSVTTLSTTNYNNILIAWNTRKATYRTDLSPHFGSSKYSAGSAAATARAALVTYGWTITDGGSI